MCPLGMCGPAHHPSAFMLTPLASWGRPVGTLSVTRGHLRTAWNKTRSELWRTPAASFWRVVVTHTPLSISQCRSCCCKGPHVGGPARKPRSAPILASAGARQPPSGRFRGPLCLPSIPKTWLQKVDPHLRPGYTVSIRCIAHELGDSPPPLVSSPLATGQLFLVTRCLLNSGLVRCGELVSTHPAPAPPVHHLAGAWGKRNSNTGGGEGAVLKQTL